MKKKKFKKYKYKKINHKINRLIIFHKDCRRKDFYSCNFSKSRSFKGRFNNSTFKNTNFRGAILTKCSFQNSSFTNVEFMGTNLKGSNFKNSIFKFCIFSATLLKNANFTGCRFEKCYFIATNLNVSKKLIVDEQLNSILATHPLVPNLQKETLKLFNRIKIIPQLSYSRILFLKKGRLNSITVKMLLEKYNEEQIRIALENILMSHNSVKIFDKVVTNYQFLLLIDKYQEKRIMSLPRPTQSGD
ncbi:pentapeptide repeat-containing protein [Neisseria elongata]|jgi:pentapeptide repeat family protein